MDRELITLLWLVGGILLIGSEAFLPGLVAVFLGVSALLVAGLRWVGLIDSVAASFFAWMGSSVAMTLALRRTVMRFFPAEVTRGDDRPEAAAYGQLVDVIETICEGNAAGRIRHEGTSWQATSTQGAIPAGTKARLVYRDNLTWVVEPLSDEERLALAAPPDDKPTN